MDLFERQLNNEFEVRKLKRSSFSLRSFARLIGISPSALSEILKGRRNTSSEMKVRIGKKLGWSDSLLDSINSGKIKTLENSSLDEICEWYYFAILSLQEHKDFQESSAWIGRRLNVDAKTIKIALKKLKQLGMLKSCEVANDSECYHSESDVSNLSIQKNHLQGLELAKSSLAEDDVEFREFRAITIALNSQQVAQYKNMVVKFCNTVEQTAAKSRDKDSVYRMNVQFFPLTKEIE